MSISVEAIFFELVFKETVLAKHSQAIDFQILILNLIRFQWTLHRNIIDIKIAETLVIQPELTGMGLVEELLMPLKDVELKQQRLGFLYLKQMLTSHCQA